MFKKFERNTAGRDFAVGDIHGEFDKLRMVLTEVKFDPATDRLFSVGDLVDRGPKSEEVIQWLVEPWFHSVQGNHEWLAQRFAAGEIKPSSYNTNGGAWMIGMMQSERQAYADAFAALPIAIEVETPAGSIGIVHADCPLVSWRDFTNRLNLPPSLGRDAMVTSALWARDRADGKRFGMVEEIAAVVVGHTPMARVTSLDNVLFIDTGACRRGGRLTLVELGPAPNVTVREVAHA